MFKAKTRRVTHSTIRRRPSADGARTWRPCRDWCALGLCLVACATYTAPEPLGPDDPDPSGDGGGGAASAGSAGSAGTGAVGGSRAPASGGTAPVPTGGAPTTGGKGTAGTSVTGGGGAAANGGDPGQPSADGGDAGAPPVVTDLCPKDPEKTAPGVCGCGFPDADTAQLGSCKVLTKALVHRYDFEGTGTAVMDRVGTAHGVIVGAATLSQVSGKGAVVLSGGATGPYVDLPNGILSSLTSATLEAWVTWGGGGAWQRIFDFGDSTSATPEDNPLLGKSYLFLTAQTSSGSGGVMRAVYSLTGGATTAETRLDGTTALAQTLTQVVVVVDATAGKLLLYVDGAKTGEQTFAGSLASINDVNVWLGRSQYDADPELTGTFHDFRIYSAALPALQIATSFAAGPDPAFLAK
jgi:hypothetical protein